MADIYLSPEEIPADLIEYFELVNVDNKKDVLNISTQPFKGSHFATYPEALVSVCIKSGSSQHGCCPACGAGWVRVVDKEFVPSQSDLGRRNITGQDFMQGWEDVPRGSTSVTTTGWQPTCDCGIHEVVPPIVLDPFCGSGTTLVVARKLGRRGVGTDLSFPYLRDQARARLGLDKLDAWRNGTQEMETKLEGLPMFEVTP